MRRRSPPTVESVPAEPSFFLDTGSIDESPGVERPCRLSRPGKYTPISEKETLSKFRGRGIGAYERYCFRLHNGVRKTKTDKRNFDPYTSGTGECARTHAEKPTAKRSLAGGSSFLVEEWQGHFDSIAGADVQLSQSKPPVNMLFWLLCHGCRVRKEISHG